MTWLTTARKRVADYYVFVTDPWRREIHKDELNLSVLRRLTHLENRMTSSENAAYDRAAEVVGLIRAEFASLRTQLADKDAALEADAQADAERITALVDELASVLPADVPEVPVPDPGVPAEVPAESPPVDDGPAAA